MRRNVVREILIGQRIRELGVKRTWKLREAMKGISIRYYYYQR